MWLLWVEVCVACGKPSVVDGDRPGPFLESEPIHCAHCRSVIRYRRTAGVYQTRPLTDTELAEWDSLGRPTGG